MSNQKDQIYEWFLGQFYRAADQDEEGHSEWRETPPHRLAYEVQKEVSGLIGATARNESAGEIAAHAAQVCLAAMKLTDATSIREARGRIEP